MKTQSRVVALVAAIACTTWSGIVLINAIGDKVPWKIAAASVGFVLFGLLFIYAILGILKSKKT